MIFVVVLGLMVLIAGCELIQQYRYDVFNDEETND